MTNSQNNNDPGSDVLSEANLWNPLWAYDLFPLVQSSWNRMPIAGADFATESSSSDAKEDPSKNPSDEPDPDISNPDNSEGSEPDDEQQDSNSDPDDSDDSDNNLDDEPSTSNDERDDEESELDEEDGNISNDGNLGDDPGSDKIDEYHLEGPKPGTPLPIPGLTITQTEAGIEYFREFNSWDEFVECVADESLYAWKNTRSSHDPNQGTAGAEASFTEAVEMARFRGWPEGRNLLSDLMANITTKNDPFEVWDLDVAGIFPIVPAFLSGDPACMIVDPMNELRTQYPIIRIDYNHEVTWNITPKDMMTRGAAILSLANNLEAHGFQIELRIVGNSTSIQYSRSLSKLETTVFKYSIVYKKPGQFLDVDRAAFAMAHPACLRRLCFALLEQHANLEASFSPKYGYPTYAPVDPESGSFGTIFIAGSKGNETEETARAAVMTAADAITSIIATAEAN